MLRHRDEYKGEWVVLSDDRLVGHTADAAEVSQIVAKAREQGILVPYVKFVSEASEPLWMGWL